MKKSRIIVAAAVLAVGMSLVASPAFAVTWDGTKIYYPLGNDGTDPATDAQYYDVDSSDFTYYGLYNQAFSDNGPSENLFDTHAFFTGEQEDTVSCWEADPTVTEATDGSGDLILLCAPQTMTDDIVVQFEFRMYADHQTTRERMILTNNSGSAIEDYVAGRDINMYVDGGTNVGWSSSGGSTMSTWPDATGVGGLTVSDADTSYVITAPPGVWVDEENHQPWLTALGDDAGAIGVFFPDGYLGGDAQNDNADDGQLEAFSFDIAIDETVSVVWMNREYLFSYNGDETASSLAAAEAAVAEAQTTVWCAGNPNNQLVVGISDASSIVNWGTSVTDCPNAQETPAPALPDTGVDSVQAGLMAAGAGAFAIAGVAILVIRRRRNA
jgi:LPXTG-motif cell wall-anchored protein